MAAETHSTLLEKMDFRKWSNCKDHDSKESHMTSESADSHQERADTNPLAWNTWGDKPIPLPQETLRLRAGTSAALGGIKGFCSQHYLLSSPSCPQAGLFSELSPGMIEGGQLKPLWLAKSWQTNSAFTELLHLGGSPFSSVTGTALALKKRSCGNPPFSKSSSPLPSKQIKYMTKASPSPCTVWQRLCQPTNCLVNVSSQAGLA